MIIIMKNLTPQMILYEVTIADKTGYPHDSFLISPLKHTLWLLIKAPQRDISIEYPQHMVSCRNKKHAVKNQKATF